MTGVPPAAVVAAALVVWAAACGDGVTGPPPEPSNRAPLAVGAIPRQTVHVGDSVALDIATYFTDPDGDSLTYQAESSSDGTATASVTGTQVTVAAIAQGSATISISATDPDGLSATQSFDVTVPNRAPLPVDSIPRLELVKGDSATIDVAGYFADPDGDSLSYSVETSNAGTATPSVDGSQITVTAIAQGSATVSVTATDPGGLSATHSFGVTVPNRAPQPVDSIPRLELLKGDSATIDVADYFTDPDGDSLSYSVESSNAGTATPSVDGSQVTVTAIAQGSATVSISATDPGGLSATHSFGVTVPNRAPQPVDSIAGIELQAGDTATMEIAEHFTDPDGDSLQYAVATSHPEMATATIEDTRVSVVAHSPGLARITITATDTGGLSASQTLDVTVERVPYLVRFAEPAVAVPEGDIASLEVVVSPTPEAPLTLSYSLGADRHSWTDDADGDDYEDEGRGTMEIAAGAGGATLRIVINDDDNIEPPREVFAVTLDAPDPGAVYVLADSLASVQVTIEEGVCDRTPGVREAIMKRLGYTNCTGVRQVGTVNQLLVCFGDEPYCTLEQPLTALKSGDFQGLRRLNSLSLQNNRLTTLPQDLFRGLTSLSSLSLNGNRITELPPDLLRGLTSLSSLRLNGNLIAELPPDLFRGLTSLSSLRLHRNLIAELPPGIFVGLSELRSLDLGYNPGAPFNLAVHLRRTDSADLLAPGPARVETWIAEGAPGHLFVPLAALGGALSADTVVVEAGSENSTEVTVTRATDAHGGTEVRGGDVVTSASLWGVRFIPADPIVLFPPEGNIVALSTRSISVPEGATAVLEVILTPPPESPLTLTFDLAVDDDPETEDADPSDFGGTVSDTLHVAAGTTRARIEIPIHDDDDIEPPREVFTIALHEPGLETGYALGHPRTAMVTITEGVCDRTPQIRDEIVRQAGVSGCIDVDSSSLSQIRILSIVATGRGPQSGPALDHDPPAGDWQAMTGCRAGTALFPYPDTVLPAPTIRVCNPEEEVGTARQLQTVSSGTSSPITGLQQGDFSGLSGLFELILQHHELGELPRGIFSDSRRLFKLNLIDNKLEGFPWRELERLQPRLWFLSLDGNPALGGIPSGLMFPNLEILFLSATGIRELSEGVFSGMPELEWLSLRSNEIASLPPGVVSGMLNLELLYLGFNELTSLSPGVFSNLPALQRLDLEALKATELPPDIFGNLPSLRDLFLNFTSLRVMPRVSGLSNLVNLIAVRNRQLREFPPGVFSELPNLQVLDLSDNPQMNLRADMFSRLSNLRRLGFHATELKEIPPRLLSGLTGLEALWLDENRLSELPAGTFSDLSGLRYLWLGGNEFTTLREGVFEDLGNLEYLRLEENRLTELPQRMFRGLTGLWGLYLHDNPGAPFSLHLEALRTDNTDLLAPGPARVEIRLDEGAPFTMRVPLSAHNGEISTNSVTLKSASEKSSPFTVTRGADSQAATQVVAGPSPPIPRNVTGIEVRLPDPLILFATASNHAPIPEREIPSLRLREGGDEASFPVAAHFRDPDGDELEFDVVSHNPDIASATVSGNHVTITPVAGGAATVAVTATDPGGLHAELRASVAVRGQNDPGSFNIDLIMVDEVTRPVATAFEDAVAYWEAILASTELADVRVGTGFQLGCADITTRERVETVDDLVIVTSVREIDGAGRVLAGAAVCAVREESGLPLVGVMVYDATDLEGLAGSDDLEEVILHEIGHVLGIGTIWSDFELLINPSLPDNQGADTHFPGIHAIGAFDDAGGEEYTLGKVPVENLAGPGSGDAHWREAVLGHELMTPYQHLGLVDPLSEITIRSLADLGYAVDATLAEPFELAAALAADVTDPTRRIEYGEDILKGPIVVVDRNGRIVRIIPE